MAADEFVAELSAHAGRAAPTGLAPIIDRLCRPVTVRTLGRPGVGRRTVTAALRAAGIPLVDTAPDVEVLVIAETAKPEDCRVTAGTDRPIQAVLNKADLLGAAAADRARLIQRRLGAPTIPMAALPVTARLDDTQWAALRVLATDPADLSSADAFRAGPHVIGPDVRAGLLAALDLPGIAAVTTAIASGRCADGAGLTTLLRRLSNIEEVLAGVHAVAAPLRYRRLQIAMTQLRALAARTGDQRLAALLAGDGAVFAAMSAAAEVLRAAGVDADLDVPLGGAVRWQRYSRGPVNALHRSCGTDMARGALRSLPKPGGCRDR